MFVSFPLAKTIETRFSNIEEEGKHLAELLNSLKRLIASIVLIIVLAAVTITFFEVFIAAPTNLSNQVDLLINISLVFAFASVVFYNLIRFKTILAPHFGIQAATIIQFLLMGLALTVTAFIILGFFHVSLSTLLTSAGIISITVGLIISTFVGGILSGALVFTTYKFKIGEDVMVNNMPGRIVDMTALVVRIRTDVGQITIPNSAIASGGVILTSVQKPGLEQEKRVPYVVGDRVMTSFRFEEGIVKELTAFHTTVLLDSGKQITYLNTSVLSGAIAIAKIVPSAEA